MPHLDLEQTLNAGQRAAVEAGDGPVLIIAAAGTGKTRTLVYRVAHLVARGINPERILLLTFTNKAAREMLARAEQLVGSMVGGLWGGTFHHMANRILRRHADALGYRLDYAILDEDDARTLVRQAVARLGLRGRHFPKPDVLLSLFSLAANTDGLVEPLAQERFAESEVPVADVMRVYAAYVERKRALHAMDFDDLLVNGLRLFRERPDLLAPYQERFLHVLVDEYQDTNGIQAEWVDLVAARHRNLLVVGDDFQSIYGWRGANFRNILDFPRRYPDAQVFKLEANYRSLPGILDVANACIAGNPEQFQKTLHAIRAGSVRPVVARLSDGDGQARYVASLLARLARRGMRMSDVAVLYRAHFHALELQLEMSRMRVPYVITSGVRFFELAHIKDVTSLVRMAVSPTDELAFRRLLGLLPGVGEKTSARLWDAMGGHFEGRSADARAQLRARLPTAARADWDLVAELFAAYVDEHLEEDPGELIYRFVERFYREYALETFENHDRRLEDIAALIDFTTRFENAESFLSEVALLTNLDAEADALPQADAARVRLSTIHQAKGLEWKTVIVLWAVEGMFPAARSLAEEDGEAEERRLFYVAATRAQDELYFCVPEIRRMRDGGIMYCEPSRFIRELPSTLYRTEHTSYGG